MIYKNEVYGPLFKKIKSDVRRYLDGWFWIRFSRRSRRLCCPNIVRSTSSMNDILRQTTRNSSIMMLKKCTIQSYIFNKVVCTSSQTLKAVIQVTENISKYGEPIIDGVFVKEAFLNCSEILFDDLPSKRTIILRKSVDLFSAG